jgi:Peptidase family S41
MELLPAWIPGSHGREWGAPRTRRLVTSRRLRIRTRFVGLASMIALMGACSGNAPEADSSSTSASAIEPTVSNAKIGTAGTSAAGSALQPSITTAPNPWAADLALLDSQVRAFHPNPFAIHPEGEWVAKLDELERSLPTATPDEQIVQFASLVALLDTHSSFDGLTKPDGPLAFRFYQVAMYGFADGWFVIRAKDPSLVGSRLVSIGGVPVADVDARLRTLIPADNVSGKLNGLDNWMSAVEYLHGLGIVHDPAKPAFVFEQPSGSQVTVDLAASPDETAWENDLNMSSAPIGKVPEAIARRSEPVWTRLDAATKSFLVSYNDYTENDLPSAIAAMTAALDDGSADHVVLDMRYLKGGNSSLADPLTQALKNDQRVNRPGDLTVLIGRENESAATVVAATLDANTQATFVGEPTPARADNFLCDCRDINLPNSGFTVRIPTFTFHTGDNRDAIAPDFPMSPTAADYFAGTDSILTAAVSGNLS